MGSRFGMASAVIWLVSCAVLTIAAVWTGLPAFYLVAVVAGVTGLSRLRRASVPDRRRVIPGFVPVRPAVSDPLGRPPGAAQRGQAGTRSPIGPDAGHPDAGDSGSGGPVPPAVHTQVTALAKAGRTVEAIDVLREAAGMELYEASQYVRTVRKSVR